MASSSMPLNVPRTRPAGSGATQAQIVQRVDGLISASSFDAGRPECKTEPLLQGKNPFPMAIALADKGYAKVIMTGWPSRQAVFTDQLLARYDKMATHTILGTALGRDGQFVSTITGVVEPLIDGGVRLGLENLTTVGGQQRQGYATEAILDLLVHVDDLPIKYAGGTSLQPYAHNFYRKCGLRAAGIEYGVDLKPDKKRFPGTFAGTIDTRYTLRTVEPLDLQKRLAELLSHSFHPEGLGLITPDIFEAYLRRCGDFKKTFVIEDKVTRRLVASGSYFNETKLTEGDGQPTGRISNLAVHPDHVGEGLDRHMFAALYDEAQKSKARCILAHGTRDQRNLFKSFGMTEKSLELGVFITEDARQFSRCHRRELEALTWKIFFLYYLVGTYNFVIFTSQHIAKYIPKKESKAKA